MKILTTGLSGCIGRALHKELLKAQHEVWVLTRGPASWDVPDHWTTITTDLNRPVESSQFPSQIDAVIHLAQSRRFREFPSGVEENFSINTAATVALAQYAVMANAKSFVYASTGSVYRPRPGLLSEDSETQPGSFYAASKLAAEVLLQPFQSLMAVSIHRLFYVYGPGQSGMLTDGLAARIRNGEPITIQSPDGITIAPTFSEDAARIALMAAERTWSGTFNVSGPEIIRLRQYANMIGEHVERKPIFSELQEAVPPTVLPDLSKLTSAISPDQLTPISEGLRATFGKCS